MPLLPRGVARNSLGVILCGVVIAGSFAVPVRGALTNDTTVQVMVNDGSIVPALSLDDGLVVTTGSVPYVLSGIATDLNQILIYVDGVLTVTIPLGLGTSAFSYGLVVPSGVHAVQLVGVSPFPTMSPTASLTLIYTPPVIPPPPASLPARSGAPGGDWQPNTHRESFEQISADSTIAAKQERVSLLPWLYNGLVLLDILRPGEPPQINVMAWRFLLVFAALSSIVFAGSVLWLYRIVRYRMLRWGVHPLPAFLRHRPLLWIRFLGLGLLVAVLCFL